MEKKLEELKMLLKDLMTELADLKERVAELENAQRGETSLMPERRVTSGQESQESLVFLYQDGYHICPMAYGRLRDGECLFCINFLETRARS